jgi:transcriptional/translational regulatory protein YebC/TACO1
MEKELDEKEILYEIVERLSRKAREEFAREFKDDLKGIISDAAISMAIRGKFHLSNNTIIKVIEVNPAAKKWIKKKGREEAMLLLNLIEELEDDDEVEEE